MQSIGGLVVSPDGRNLYAAAATSSAVVVFVRDPTTGAIAQLPGAAACIAETGTPGTDACASGRGLRNALRVAVSPDGAHVYVTGAWNDAAAGAHGAVAAFARDAATGALTQLDGAAGCIAMGGEDGCTPGRGLGFANGIVAAPDGAHLYVAATAGDSIAILARDAATGALSQSAGAAGCIARTGDEECAAVRGLRSPVAAAMAADGTRLYVASYGSVAAPAAPSSVIALGVGADGSLVQSGGKAGCLVAAPLAGCGLARGIRGAYDVAVAGDGRTVWATGSADGAVAVLRRVGGGLVQDAPRLQACASERGVLPGAASGCIEGRGLASAYGLSVAADGSTLAVASGAGLAVLRRVAVDVTAPKLTLVATRIAPSKGGRWTFGLRCPKGEELCAGTLDVVTRSPERTFGTGLRFALEGGATARFTIVARVGTEARTVLQSATNRGRIGLRVRVADPSGNLRRQRFALVLAPTA